MKKIFLILILGVAFFMPQRAQAGGCPKKRSSSAAGTSVKVCPYAGKSAASRKFSAEEIRKRQEEFRKKALKNRGAYTDGPKDRLRDEFKRNAAIEKRRAENEKRLRASQARWVEIQKDIDNKKSGFTDHSSGSITDEYWRALAGSGGPAQSTD